MHDRHTFVLVEEEKITPNVVDEHALLEQREQLLPKEEKDHEDHPIVITLNLLFFLMEDIEEKIFLNLLRDLIWEYLAKENIGITGQATDNVQSQWLAQFVFATFSMTRAAIARKSPHKSTGKEKYIPLLAASAAIYPWNYGQQLGAQFGTDFLNLSKTPAAYFSSLFTGVFEGTTQYLVTKVGHLLIDAETRKKFTIKSFMQELGLNMTIGALPGAAWQIVSETCSQTNSFFASGVVASTVAICNVISENVIKRVTRPRKVKSEEESYQPPEFVEEKVSSPAKAGIFAYKPRNENQDVIDFSSPVIPAFAGMTLS
jgi:hypothetical protein